MKIRLIFLLGALTACGKNDDTTNAILSATIPFYWVTNIKTAENTSNEQKTEKKSSQQLLVAYCEDMGDGRGITVSIQSTITGRPKAPYPVGPDLFKRFNKYNGAENPTVSGGLSDAGVQTTMQGNVLHINESTKSFCAKINKLSNNSAWHSAIWESFYDNTL